MVIVTVVVGLLVGIMVGISGIGGAILLLPLLIVVLKVPPLMAIGTDAVCASITKMAAGTVHWRQGTVDLKIVLALALGSIPGALIGFSLLTRLSRMLEPEILNHFLTLAIGSLLIIVPVVMLVQNYIERKHEKEREPEAAFKLGPTVLTGLVGGVLVGLTSVGSGSIILVALLILYRRTPAELVGTDVVHALLLTGLTGALHYSVLGTVDLTLVGWLVLGSIPGSMIGARISVNVPGELLKRGLLALLVGTGIYLLF